MTVPLKQLQNLLYRLITAASGVAEGLESERGMPAGGLDAIVLGDERLSAEARVDIYANMYFYRIRDALKEDLRLGRHSLQRLVNFFRGIDARRVPIAKVIDETGPVLRRYCLGGAVQE